jgi:integrase
MKMRESHIVPLSRQAAEILREIQLLTGNGRWVFPPNCATQTVPCPGPAFITAALRAIGYSGAEMSWHVELQLRRVP